MHIKQIKGASGKIACQLQIRIYSTDDKSLLKIKEFLGYGNIYSKKKTRVYELVITKKKDALNT